MPVRILVVDDQPVARRGLTALLRQRSHANDWSVECFLFDAGPRPRDAGPRPRDLVLLSPGRNGEGFRLLERWQIESALHPTIVVPERDTPMILARSVALGARECVPKSAPARHLFEAITRSLAGKTASQKRPLGAMRAFMREVPPPLGTTAPMTPRERQVWRHLGLGLGNSEIALSLGLTVETVKEHVQNVLRKLNASGRTEAAVRALRAGIA